ncbi:CARDB domain-containing protein [Scytonema hofmannii]|uniref:CARDB domain-containing protein n=1 Tax=Scytonema hofmannii TaxID=34078 RepID=UPI0009D6F5E9
MSVSWTVKNQGSYRSEANWVDRIYISSDQSWDDSDTYVYGVSIDEQTPLEANNGNDSTYSIKNKVITIPTTMTGERYLLFITDATGNPRDLIGNQSESNETNNTYAVPIEIEAPDLTVKEAGRPNPGTTTWTATWGEEIPVFWTVENTSDAAAPANWYDRVYISSDDKLNGDTLLYSEFIDTHTPLAGLASYNINNKLITIPKYDSYIRGNQYLLFVTDANQDQGETNEAKGLLETNNVKPVPIFIAAPDLVVESVTAVPSTSAQFGQTIDVTYFVSNAGDPGSSTVASRWTDRIWLSKGSTLDSPRIELTSVSVERDTPLNSGTSYSKTVTVPLPLNPQFSNGTYYIWVETDTSYNQVEFNENNNKFSQPINLTLPTIPDLQVTSVVTPFEGLSGQKLEIVWTIYNGGDKDATGVWHDNVYLSKDGSIGNGDFYASFSFEGTIQAGKPIERRQFIDLPIDLEGDRWVVVKTDAGGDVYEHGQESNNTRISSNPIDIRKSDFPNLKVSSVTARTDSAFSGQKITIDWVVENTGTGSTSAPIWYDAVFLSLNGQETYLGQTSNFSYLDKYGSGIHSYNNSLEVTLPDNIEGNNYYFVVKTDYYDNVYEYQNEDDNFRSTESPTNIELTPPPDLQPTVNEHSPVFSGQRMTLNWTVVNNGPGKTSQHSWYDEVYMSADPYLGNGDEEYFLGSRYHYGDLDVYDANSTNGATSSYTTSLDVTLPIGVSGNFYFIVRTDAGNQVLEFAGDANNIVAQPTPTTVNLTPPPDLEVELVDVPTQALASHALTIDYRVTNNGSTATPNYSWVDAFYLSEDANFNSSTDRLLGEIRHHGSLDIDEPNKWYDGSATFTLPDGLSGTFHVFVVTDQHNDVFELNNHNNVNNYDNVGNNVGVVTVSSRPADLVVSAIDVPTTLEAGIASRIKWTVANTGTGDTAVRAWTDKIIASGDPNLGNDDDVVLGSFYHSDTLSLIDGTYRSGLLNPGDFYERNELVTIPFTMSGQYHLFVVTDANAQVYEANALGNNYKSQLITVNRDTPDLQVTGVNATPSVSSTDKLAVNWTVKNFGIGRTNAYSWYDSVYLSTDTQLNFQQDIYLGQVFHSGALDQFGSYDGSGTFNLPIDLKGNYHVIVRTDNSANSEYNDRVLEGSLENNNDKATNNTTAITLGEVPNLVVESVDAPIDAISSQLFNLTWTVRNDGAATGYKRWYDAIYLSRDQNFDRSSDIYLDYRYRVGGLAAGETYTQQNQLFKIPSGLSGPFYVFVVADGGNEVYERGGEGNTVGNNLNYDRNSVQVSLPNPTDLSVGTITVPVNAVPGLDATISYTINNLGPNAAQGIWYDSIYLSADDKWDINDTFFGRSQAPVSYVAAPGNDYSYYDNSITAPLPGVVPGDYHVIVKSDIRNAIVENDENNNIGGSLDKVSIDVESLQLDVSKTGTLFQGQSVYYKIDVDRAFYQTRLDLTATKGIYVDVVAGIDIATGQAFWELTSIDPTTGVEPTNPLQGFLPPNITKPEGDGFVSYSVKPKSSVENGAVIDAQARIIFDINEPIDTPAIFNTIDKSKPTSTVSALPSATNDTSFSVSWSGSDNTDGSALAGFTIYVSDNGGAFVPWLENTTLTEATFTGNAGQSYAFYSRARDNAGNTEDAPQSVQTSITINDDTDDVLPMTRIGIPGRDILIGRNGNDILNGRKGNDLLIGGALNDTLIGGTGRDTLDGGTGDDTLLGGSGNDTLIGGFGNDVLTGGAGADIFVLNNPNTGVDSITDFSVVDDTLRVSAAGFGGALAVGEAITSSQFLIGSGAVAATNSSQRFIYNTTTGALFFDADGNQTAFGVVQVAMLSNKPTIGTSDIFVTT